eukprot:ANDGO_05123.mRNA.1 187-kDa microtubule-associated protein AIR9
MTTGSTPSASSRRKSINTSVDLSRLDSSKSTVRSARHLSSAASHHDDDNILEALRPQNGRLSLNSQGLTSLDSLFPHVQRAEFLYLRDNCLSSFSSFSMLPQLKVLDLSCNALSHFDLLAPLPNLRQLFLSGNYLTTLFDFPKFDELQVLSLAHNALESLDGMPLLPSLLVLALGSNRLQSLGGMPRHPKLESISIEENPVCEKVDVRTALIGMSSASLRRINGKDVSEEERMQSSRLVDTKTAVCLREGWIPASKSSFDSELANNSKISTPGKKSDKTNLEQDVYLEQLQKEASETMALRILHVKTASSGKDGAVMEGSRLKLEVILQLNTAAFAHLTEHPEKFGFLPSHMLPVTLSHATIDEVVFQTPKLASPVHMSRSTSKAAFETTLFLTPGKYVYSIGGQKSEITVTSEDIQKAKMQALRETDGCATPGIFTVQWYRSTRGCGGDFVELEKSSSSVVESVEQERACEYDLVLDDVDCCLMAEITAFAPSYLSSLSPFSCFAITSIIQPAPPSVRDVKVTGEPVEGGELSVEYHFYGGVEGTTTVEWVSKADGRVLSCERTYYPTVADIGKLLSVRISPSNDRGETNTETPVFVHNLPSVIREGPPAIRRLWLGRQQAQAVRLRVPDDEEQPARGNDSSVTLENADQWTEDETLVVSGDYFGGVEGNSTLQIYRVAENAQEVLITTVERQPTSAKHNNSVVSLSYTPTLADVGCHLKLVYTPISSQKVKGQASVLQLPTAVAPRNPVFVDFKFSPACVFEEASKLCVDYSYKGGFPAEQHDVAWFRLPHNNASTAPVEIAKNTFEYIPTREDLGHALRVVAFAVRRDYTRSASPVELTTPATIAACAPRVTSVSLNGARKQGSDIGASYGYVGGDEGKGTRVTWERSKDGVSGWKEIEDSAGDRTITLGMGDVDHFVRATVTPQRSDGTFGTPVSAQTEAVVSYADPIVHELSLPDEIFDGESFRPNYVYWGGPAGKHLFQYFLVPSLEAPREHWTAINDVPVEASDFLPLNAHCNSYIALEMTPVRFDNVRGEPSVVISSSPVKWTLPRVALLAFTINATLVDGQETVEEGTALTYDYSYMGGPEGDSIFEWTRIAGDPVVVSRSRDPYVLQREDIGAFMAVSVTPVRVDGVRGEPVQLLLSAQVIAAPPHLSRPLLRESPSDWKQGCPVVFEPNYVGGTEGDSTLSIFPEPSSFIELENGKRQPLLGLEHVHRIVRVEYTPVRSDGTRGQTVTVSSNSAVAPAAPVVSNVRIETLPAGAAIAEALPPIKLVGKGEYYGGYEGSSLLTWYRLDPKTDKRTKVSEDFAPTYTVSAQDTGHHLVFEYTPVRSDGAQGPAVSVQTATPVAALPPAVSDVRVEGGPFFTYPLTVLGNYVGGLEGRSEFQWLRKSAGEPLYTPIEGDVGRQRQYKPNADDLHASFRVRYTPVRSDGVKGTPVESSADGLEVYLDADFAMSLQKHFENGEATLQGKNTEANEDQLITLTSKKVLIGNEKKAVFKEEWAQTFFVECRGENQAFFSFKKKEFTFQFPTQKDRDYVAVVFRAFLGLEKKMAKELEIDKAMVKDFQSKDSKRRSTVVETLSQTSSSLQLSSIENVHSRRAAVVLEALRSNSKALQSKLAKARIDREQREEKLRKADEANAALSSGLQVCPQEDKDAWCARLPKFDSESTTV